jgi:hypothetical protein
MSVADRKKFQDVLQRYLKENLLRDSNVSIVKDGIKVRKTRDNNATGSILLSYINGAQGYHLVLYAKSPEVDDFFAQIKPPYKSTLPWHTDPPTMSMLSVNEKDNYFAANFCSEAPDYSAIPCPISEPEIQRTCEWLCAKIQQRYLPRVINVVNMTLAVIEDVIANPDDYAYPFLTILFAIKKHGLRAEDLDMEKILGEKFVGDMQFDKNLLDAYFSKRSPNINL